MFHIPTLIAVMIIVQTIMVGLLFMAWRYNRRVPAVNMWFFTFALLLVGSVLLLPRQTLPPWITIVLANSVLVTGYCVSVIGIRHYTGRPPLPWGYVGGTLALFALILGYFTYIEPDFSLRVAIYGVFSGGISLLAAYEGIQRSGRHNMATLFFGVLSAFHGLFLLGRGIFSSLSKVENTFGSGANLLTQLVFIEGIVVTVLLGVSYIFLTTEYLSENLRRLTERDPLTKVFNRRVFFLLAEKAISYSRRTQTPLTMLFLDLDHFKKINDTYGHGVGDEVLSAFTQSVEGILRTEDILGRIGGEEFGIFLPEVDEEDALDIANRICLACKNLCVETERGDVRFTISIGAAALSDEERVQDLLHLADQALYAAKEAGRNQVAFASAGPG